MKDKNTGWDERVANMRPEFLSGALMAGATMVVHDDGVPAGGRTVSLQVGWRRTPRRSGRR